MKQAYQDIRPAKHMNTLQRMRDSYETNKSQMDQVPAEQRDAVANDIAEFVAALDWAIERLKLS